MPLRHAIEFTEAGRRFELIDERIENESPHQSQPDVYFYYRFQHNRPVLNVKGDRRELRREDVDPEKSILSQRKDPDQYPEITYLGGQFERIRIYREWSFGRYTAPRQAHGAPAPSVRGPDRAQRPSRTILPVCRVLHVSCVFRFSIAWMSAVHPLYNKSLTMPCRGRRILELQGECE